MLDMLILMLDMLIGVIVFILIVCLINRICHEELDDDFDSVV